MESMQTPAKSRILVIDDDLRLADMVGSFRIQA